MNDLAIGGDHEAAFEKYIKDGESDGKVDVDKIEFNVQVRLSSFQVKYTLYLAVLCSGGGLHVVRPSFQGSTVCEGGDQSSPFGEVSNSCHPSSGIIAQQGEIAPFSSWHGFRISRAQPLTDCTVSDGNLNMK